MKKAMKKLMTFLLCLAILAGVSLTPDAQAASASSSAGIISTSHYSLNVRASANTGSSILTSLPKGSYVTLISQSGSWWKVEYAAGRYGYVSAAYIKQASGTSTAAVGVSWGSLNVRYGPGTSYGKKASLYKGTMVVVLSASNGWSKILYSGTQTGYVSSAYLSSTSAYTPVKNASMTWPVPASAKLAQYFVSGSHYGVDISPQWRGVAGDRVISAAGGSVVYAGWLSGYGYVVYVNSTYNGRYIQTRYGHLACQPDVHVGDTVYAGQTLGYMGNTGTSTGVHLHFEVRLRDSGAACVANADSTAVNPLNYVSA